MTSRTKIFEDMTTALREHDQKKLAAIRLFWAAIRQKEIDSRVQGKETKLDDTQVLAVLEKMIKQRRDSIEQYTAGNRLDLAAKEAEEIEVLQIYLPQQFTKEELEKIIQEAVQSSGATSTKDVGKVIGLLKTKIQGRADMGAVSARIKEILT